MSNKLAIQRLLREQQKMQESPNNSFFAIPSTDNIFEWHFVLYNFSDDPYINGQFHGKLIIPVEYPMKPPTLYFITPQGRFKIGEKICLSFTSYHPESWSTSWTISSMLIGLISFMYTKEMTTGGVQTSDSEKRQLAEKSIKFNLANPEFEKHFKPYYEQLGIKNMKEVRSSVLQMGQPTGKINFIAPSVNDDDQTFNLKKSAFLVTGIVIIIYIYLCLKQIT